MNETRLSETDRGGPAPENSLEFTGSGSKPAMLTCPECGTQNIQGTDFCINCEAPLRSMDIPSDSWSPAIGPPGEAVEVLISHEPLRIAPTVSVRDAVAHLRDGGQGCVVVVDGGRVVGIFTERDVLNKVTPDREAMMSVAVSELMTPNPETVLPDDSILVAINRMGDGGYRHLPLVDADGALKGILSGRDILSYVADQL